MSLHSSKNKMDDGIRALLIWRDLEFSNENIKKINKSDVTCVFRTFPKFSIIRLRSKIEEYRNEYTRTTKKDWRRATINDIFKAELVW